MCSLLPRYYRNVFHFFCLTWGIRYIEVDHKHNLRFFIKVTRCTKVDISVEIHASIVEFRSGLINDGYKHHTSQIIKK